MLNPVLKSNRSRIIYLVIWVAIMVAHSFLLNFYFALPVIQATGDAVIYNLCYLLFGIGIWYIVRYNNFELKKLIYLVGAHALSAIFILSLWIGISGLIAGIFFRSESYLSVAAQVFPLRVLLGILYYVVIVLVYYLLVYYQVFRERISLEANIATMHKEAELNALKSQINPHFIFNSLNSISSLTLSDPEKAQEMIVKLSEFFRLTLKKGDLQLTSLNNELKFSRLYFEIEKIRFGEKLQVGYDIPESLGNIEVPHLILQPLLENAIKHGVQESLNTVHVELAAQLTGNFMNLILKNHFDRGQKVSGEGIGLFNVRERLRLIYGSQDLLLIENEHGTNVYTVTVKIPLNLPDNGKI